MFQKGKVVIGAPGFSISRGWFSCAGNCMEKQCSSVRRNGRVRVCVCVCYDRTLKSSYSLVCVCVCLCERVCVFVSVCDTTSYLPVGVCYRSACVNNPAAVQNFCRHNIHQKVYHLVAGLHHTVEARFPRRQQPQFRTWQIQNYVFYFAMPFPQTD